MYGLKDVVGGEENWVVVDLGLFGGKAHAGFKDPVKGLQNGFQSGGAGGAAHSFDLDAAYLNGFFVVCE